MSPKTFNNVTKNIHLPIKINEGVMHHVEFIVNFNKYLAVNVKKEKQFLDSFMNIYMFTIIYKKI